MIRSVPFKLAALGFTALAGFGVPQAGLMADDGASSQVNPTRAARSAERAGDALERGRHERAVRFAEEAVAMAPADAEYRVLLGQAYMADGRFASAEASFDAARQLGAAHPRAIIGHTLALIATGRNQQALDLIDANASILPASDFGLALALAGQAERGALVLTDVVRAGDSTPRDRQNLALAYALAGRWLEARLIGGQDVGPARIGERLQQWAAMAQAGDPRQRIAGLIGASISNDPGMPVRLALRSDAPQMAMATIEDPAPLEIFAPAAPASGAELVAELLDEAPASTEPAVQPVAVAAVTPVEVPASQPAAAPQGTVHNGILFVSNPIIQPLRGVVAMVAPLADPVPVTASQPAPRAVRTAGRVSAPSATAVAAAAPAAAPAPTRAAAPTGPVRTSGWAIQLGAFDSVGVAQNGWASHSRRYSQLAGHDGVSVSATISGRTVYRLVATGFDSRAEAAATCTAMRRQGSDCFVRQVAPNEPVRWASRQAPTRVAAR